MGLKKKGPAVYDIPSMKVEIFIIIQCSELLIRFPGSRRSRISKNSDEKKF